MIISKKLLNQTNKENLVAKKELVRQVPSLVKVLGEKPTSAPAAKGSSGNSKPDVDGELLNKLMHPQLID
jgi:hypothetical protein